MSLQKHTLILGASNNPNRYAHRAAEMLTETGHPLSLVSVKKGELFGQSFMDLIAKPSVEGVHTITLYIGSRHLDEWIEYILSLKPKRIVMNPGTEHHDLKQKAEELGIEVVIGCTLVMLRTGQY